jgi:nucleotide-binding universal stress UspA family protein
VLIQGLIHPVNIIFQPEGVPMFHRILVAMDGSEAGDRVFEEALTLAKANQARLMLMHVFLMPAANQIDLWNDSADDHRSETDSNRQEKAQFEKAKQQCLERLRVRHRNVTSAGMNADVGLLEGDPGKQICNAARKWGADLILMGHRGLSEQEEKVMASASNYVLHHAPCSMHIVQNGGLLPQTRGFVRAR